MCSTTPKCVVSPVEEKLPVVALAAVVASFEKPAADAVSSFRWEIRIRCPASPQAASEGMNWETFTPSAVR